jgi:hypothetical protein
MEVTREYRVALLTGRSSVGRERDALGRERPVTTTWSMVVEPRRDEPSDDRGFVVSLSEDEAAAFALFDTLRVSIAKEPRNTGSLSVDWRAIADGLADALRSLGSLSETCSARRSYDTAVRNAVKR